MQHRQKKTNHQSGAPEQEKLLIQMQKERLSQGVLVF